MFLTVTIMSRLVSLSLKMMALPFHFLARKLTPRMCLRMARTTSLVTRLFFCRFSLSVRRNIIRRYGRDWVAIASEEKLRVLTCRNATRSYVISARSTGRIYKRTKERTTDEVDRLAWLGTAVDGEARRAEGTLYVQRVACCCCCCSADDVVNSIGRPPCRNQHGCLLHSSL